MPLQYVGNSITKAAEPDGSGGYRSKIPAPEPAGDPVISSVTDNGDGALTITGSGFGSKVQAAPRHWEMGSDILINGISVAQNAVGSGPSADVWRSHVAEITDSGIRHTRDSVQYKAVNGEGRVLKSAGFISAAGGYPSWEGHKKLYLSYWIKPGSNYSMQRVIQISGSSGTFQFGSDRFVGEDVEVNNGSETRTGKVVFINSSAITIQSASVTLAIDTTFVSTGATVTGVSSGATATIPSSPNIGIPWSVKHWRVHQVEGIGSDFPNSAWNFSSVSGGLSSWAFKDAAGNTLSDSEADESGTGYPAESPNQWHFLEAIVDYSGAAGIDRVWLDGVQIVSHDNLRVDALNTETGFALDNIGIDTPGVGPFTAADAGIGGYFGSIYADNDTRRFYLTDNPVFSSSTKFELQRPTLWNNSEVELVINRGAIGDLEACYLHYADLDVFVGGVEV